MPAPAVRCQHGWQILTIVPLPITPVSGSPVPDGPVPDGPVPGGVSDPGRPGASALDDLLVRLHELHPKIIDLSLGRIERLLEKLGSPEKRLPAGVFHVAGTNGKGSTVAFLRSMLEAAGLTVHVLYLAASGGVQRTHPPGQAGRDQRADRRCDAGPPAGKLRRSQ